jgi:hypothetical protein
MAELAASFPRLALASADRRAQNGVVETYPLELHVSKVR